MTPAQPEPQVGHRTRAWCAATRGARDADRDQSRASRMPGKCGPRTGDDPRDPHRPGALTACHRVLWHTRKERRTTGPVGYGPAQRDFRAAWEELLRNHKMRSYKKKRLKNKTVTIKPGCGNTMIMHIGPSPMNCRERSRPGQVPCTWQAHFAVEKKRNPQDPDRSNTRPARH